MRLYWGGALNAVTGVYTRMGHAHTRGRPCEEEAAAGRMQPQAKASRDAGNHQRPEEAGRTLPGACRGRGGGGAGRSAAPGSRTSGLRNRVRTRFCGCKPPSRWYFVMAAPASDFRGFCLSLCSSHLHLGPPNLTADQAPCPRASHPTPLQLYEAGVPRGSGPKQ